MGQKSVSSKGKKHDVPPDDRDNGSDNEEDKNEIRHRTESTSPKKGVSSIKKMKRSFSSKLERKKSPRGDPPPHSARTVSHSSLTDSHTHTSPHNTSSPPLKKSKKKNQENEIINELCSNNKKVSADDFNPLCVIGRGSFGKVLQVQHKETGQVYAMKMMKKDTIIAKNQVGHTKDEKHILQKIRHPFIVNLNFAFQSKDKLYLILDYVNGGELFNHLKKCVKFEEERTSFYAAEIASALMHLHEYGILYRDLKPENLLLDSEGHIVITDFGLSKEIRSDDTHTFCGTPEYLAPEILTGSGHSYPVDWWSLGILTFEMLTGLPPFYSQEVSEMYQNIVNADIEFPEYLSQNAVNFVSGLLEKEPEDRLTAEQIKNHPFFAHIDWDKLVKKEIPPPWVPPVTDVLDTGQIDEGFLREDIFDSESENDAPENKDLFKGFTYEKAGIMDVIQEEDAV